MKRMLVVLCLGVLVSGCAQSKNAGLQDRCSAGDQAACEELAREQRPSYEQQAATKLQETRPVIPPPASATPPGGRSP